MLEVEDHMAPLHHHLTSSVEELRGDAEWAISSRPLGAIDSSGQVPIVSLLQIRKTYADTSISK